MTQESHTPVAKGLEVSFEWVKDRMRVGVPKNKRAFSSVKVERVKRLSFQISHKMIVSSPLVNLFG